MLRLVLGGKENGIDHMDDAVIDNDVDDDHFSIIEKYAAIFDKDRDYLTLKGFNFFEQDHIFAKLAVYKVCLKVCRTAVRKKKILFV